MTSGRLFRNTSHQRSRISADRGVTPAACSNGILYVLTTGCTWLDVPANYGTKSTVHRYHLELCEKGVYQAIFLDLLRSGYEIKKIDLSHCATDTKDIPAKCGDRPAMMAIKR
ncbi:transposase [Methanoculleus bovis]|jgi:transposase